MHMHTHTGILHATTNRTQITNLEIEYTQPSVSMAKHALSSHRCFGHDLMLCCVVLWVVSCELCVLIHNQPQYRQIATSSATCVALCTGENIRIVYLCDADAATAINASVCVPVHHSNTHTLHTHTHTIAAALVSGCGSRAHRAFVLVRWR